MRIEIAAQLTAVPGVFKAFPASLLGSFPAET